MFRNASINLHLSRPRAHLHVCLPSPHAPCSTSPFLPPPQAYESPLTVVVSAGAVALPALLKMAQVMERSGQDLRSAAQLPIELELGPDFVFHSIFACPVSKEQATPDNPAMLLPCGHMLCEQSVMKIARGRSKILKCPYCPTEARADNLRTVTFSEI